MSLLTIPGYRDEDHCVPGFNLIVIDVDKGSTIQQAQGLLKDYKWMMYTTKRHTDEEHRFRIIFPSPFVLKFDAQEYKEFMRNIYDWLPFEVDAQTHQRARKWLSHKAQYWYNEGELLDVLAFIPKTAKNETRKKFVANTISLSNLQRWFASKMQNGERNNHFLRYAMMLVDSGLPFDQIRDMVLELNAKLPDPLDDQEIHTTVMVSVAKAIHNKQ
jgi:hypothetical protein